jgi:hypothetical protein
VKRLAVVLRPKQSKVVPFGAEAARRGAPSVPMFESRPISTASLLKKSCAWMADLIKIASPTG